ncbi:calcyphosin-2 isoform X1 [Paramormyrops kingsleyae]|uniref:Calcyphosine 2 n=2 Tax=Paramormyrops kingsleyae TaxID=1676925 RepID=A0A3B3Q6T7_9TELE|nr:calcyphosin-2 isoform X1 [Paramormyrops kingsleyae]
MDLKKISVTSRRESISPRKTGGNGKPAVICSRPDEVPALNLHELFEDEDVTYNPACHISPPDSSSALSWSPPASIPRYQSSPWGEEMMVPSDLPPPSERYRMRYERHEAELKESWKPDSQREISRRGTATAEPPWGLAVCADDRGVEEEEALGQQCYFTMQPSMRKMEEEDVAMEKRTQAVVEQVMVDQLSRAVISDPDQNSSALERIPSAAFGYVPLRFKKRTLHETKVKTSSTMTEHLLSNKLRFVARLLSRNGRDASRELVGFFFTYDDTLTIYEYRHFGKNRTNALPFIPKGSYRHQCGRRKGSPYSIHDICVGASLLFSTSGQNLPECVRQRPWLWVRITDVDELTKNKLLCSVGDGKQDELEDRNTLKVIQGRVREKLKERGIRTLVSLGQHLQMKERNGDGLLTRDEAWRVLEEYRLSLSDKELDDIWRILDEDGDGCVDCSEFIRGVIGEMNEFRKSFVRKAYMKLDPTKSGHVLMTDIEKFYCTKGHPKVISGEATEEELHAGFMETLQCACTDLKTLSYGTFEDYYEGLSIKIADDLDFASVLKSSWGI